MSVETLIEDLPLSVGHNDLGTYLNSDGDDGSDFLYLFELELRSASGDMPSWQLELEHPASEGCLMARRDS